MVSSLVSPVIKMNSNQHLKQLVKQLFDMLDTTEESENGRVFHPIQISCCRAMMIEPLGQLLDEIKQEIQDK
jgi:hypothetical protein